MVALTVLVQGKAVLYLVWAAFRLAAAIAPALHLFAIVVSSCRDEKQQAEQVMQRRYMYVSVRPRNAVRLRP